MLHTVSILFFLQFYRNFVWCENHVYCWNHKAASTTILRQMSKSCGFQGLFNHNDISRYDLIFKRRVFWGGWCFALQKSYVIWAHKKYSKTASKWVPFRILLMMPHYTLPPSNISCSGLWNSSKKPFLPQLDAKTNTNRSVFQVDWVRGSQR